MNFFYLLIAYYVYYFIYIKLFYICFLFYLLYIDCKAYYSFIYCILELITYFKLVARSLHVWMSMTYLCFLFYILFLLDSLWMYIYTFELLFFDKKSKSRLVL